ncbi:MAG: GIY-YIG nuclease family protein [Patescibacteria group bacterium]|jgi:predicted GIY-YIG superfamily endonuclease|nr:GIY-YIG nuclease family protein [Patescibacteria group bacterium]
MYYVYILKSLNNNEKYIGYTEDLNNRLTDHNSGKSKHTSKYKPWKVIWYCAFEDKEHAIAFEKYLKSGSGKAFASKRLI